ncbi:MAG: long-chain fatty acid--CoA ligase [bacterium]|nr:long-chain fatty acid--CoA ligase [bacterium]
MSTGLAPVHTLLEHTVQAHGDAVGLVHGKKSLTWAEVETAANRTARLLVELGVAPGDRVGLLVDNGVTYVTSFFGILKAGACAVALNAANRADTQRKLLADAGARVLVTKAAQARRDLPEMVAGLDDLTHVVVDRAAPHWELPAGLSVVTTDQREALPGDRLDLAVELESPAAILYTSGSTGMPRGVTLLHRNLAANTRQILDYLELTSDDSVLAVLPFHYSFGMSLLLTHTAVGGRLVVDNRFAYPATIVDALAEHAVSGFSGVPSTYAILAARTDFLTRPLPALRYLTQAGGGMTPALTRKLLATRGQTAQLFVMYGQTEAGARLSWVPPERLEEKLGSIGVGIPGVELAVRRPDGSECDVDEVGEVVARGDNIMRGYWNDPDETALVLKGGALFTGDLGRRDDDGFIFLVDRVKNMIKAGANRVSAKEIEDAIAELEGVMEVCVVGVPDELLGEAIEAHVVSAPGAELDERAVLAHLRGRLALFKIPRVVQFRKDLPRSSAGKILKSEL